MPGPDIASVATYHLEIGEGGQVVQTNGEPFDSSAYSRMKHGVIDDIRLFADGLASTLCNEAPEIVYDEVPPNFVVAYESMPHAATVVAKFCLNAVNTERNDAGLVPGNTLRIHTTDYMEPYSHSPVAERERILRAQTGIVSSHAVQSGRPVIIDDIRVTGSQERWFLDILAPHTDGPISAAYIASFPDGNQQHPELEGSLDDASIVTLHDLLPHMEMSGVVATHKLLRDLLLAAPDELSYFLSYMPDDTLKAVVGGIAGMATDTLEPYRANCQTILARHQDVMLSRME